MKRKISNIKPAKTLSLEFENGTVKNLKFNTYTMFILDQEFEEGSMSILINSIKKPYAEGSKVVYAGLKAVDEEITYDEAKKITTMLDVNTIIEIVGMASDSVVVEKDKKKATLTQEELNLLGQIFK